MNRGQFLAGVSAQVLAQAVTGWSLLAHLADWQNASVWVAAPLVAALVVPFRHDGTLDERAVGNFGSAIAVSGILWWEVMLGSVDGILGGGGTSLGPVALLLLVSTVLFSLAGGMFWVLRSNEER